MFNLETMKILNVNTDDEFGYILNVRIPTIK